MDERAIRGRVEAAGQGHVFRFWDRLDDARRQRLLRQLSRIDFETLERLIAQVKCDAPAALPADLEPAAVVSIPATDEGLAEERQAREAGEAALRSGRVAALVVAGGQGTRLGWDGPKGTFPIGAVSRKSLFQLQTEKVLAARTRYEQPIPWLVMTSFANDAVTRAFFAQHGRFGLPDDDLLVFSQGTMPAVDLEGHLLLDDIDHVAESPNGHGGVLFALESSGALAQLRRRDIDLISYIQVDNVLVKSIDPVFIGRHVLAGAEMSSKVCRKRDAAEPVGVVCVSGGQLGVVEYSDLPDDMKAARRPDGRLRFEMGSIAIHVLSVDFVERAVAAGPLPFHLVRKRVPYVVEEGRRVEPPAPDVVKFEMFVFDALRQARESVTMEVAREEEFAPVKNAAGEDSPATARRMMTEWAARRLEAVGCRPPRDERGRIRAPIEISPLLVGAGEEALSRSGRDVDFSGPVYLEP